MTDIFRDLELPDQLHALMNLGMKSEETEVSDQIEEGIEMQPQHESELSLLTLKSTGAEPPPSLCSLCANPGDDLIDISGHSELHRCFVEKIKFCLPAIEMEKTDSLTNKACQLCLAQLELCYQFLKAVAKANKKLRPFDKRKSDEHRQRNERTKTPPPCMGQYDIATLAHDEQKLDITSTFFAGELPITDGHVRSNVILSNLTNADGDGSTNSSNDKHGKLDSSTNEFNFTRSLSQVGQGASHSPPNDRVHPVEKLRFDRDVSDSEPYAPPVTRSGTPLNNPREKSMEDNNTGDLSSGKKRGEEKDRKTLYTKGKKMKKKSVLNGRNECKEKFVSKSELEYHERCSYESPGEPGERQDSGEVMDTEIISQKSEASSCGGLALTEENEFSCAHCKKTFKSNSGLSMHIRVHIGERPYRCEFCPKTFARAWDRRRHHRVHKREPSYKCSICEITFHSRYALSNHLLTHSGKNLKEVGNSPRPSLPGQYPCSQCGLPCKSRSQLIVHTRVHTGERPYSCDFCPKTFRSVSNKNAHVKVHTGIRPLQCFICKEIFGDTRKRDIHICTQHTVEK